MQEEAVEYVGATMQRLLEEDAGHKRLFLIQTYNIGKERVFLEVRCTPDGAHLGWLAQTLPPHPVHSLYDHLLCPAKQVARRCKCKLYCTERKLGMMQCLDMPGAFAVHKMGFPVQSRVVRATLTAVLRANAFGM